MISLAKFLLVTCVLAIVQHVHCNHEQFFLQKSTGEGDDRLLLVKWEGSDDDEINAICDVISGRDEIEEILKQADYPDVETITEDEMEEYLQECDTSNNIQYGPKKTKTTKTTSETTTPGYDGIPVIFPGTKWCGAGDRAKNYDDLGLHQDTDRCCRAHDLCNDTLAPGESRNGLKNTSPFTKYPVLYAEEATSVKGKDTFANANPMEEIYKDISISRLSCQCDMDFYNCLDKVNSVTSNTIGNMYFNILKRECYEKDYPDSKKCKKYTLFRIKCLEYEKDTKKPKVYKWVKAKKYKKIPFPGPLTVTLPDIIPF